MQHREQVSRFKREHLGSLGKLDLATKSILDAIVDKQDVFQAAHEAQLALTKTLHENTMGNIDDTRQGIIGEIRVNIALRGFNVYTYSRLETTARYCRTGTVARQTAQYYT